jgi:signal transduction histidine kinase/FixJ family two-component response regulator
MAEDQRYLLRTVEREKAARLEAERLLEEKSDALYESLTRIQSSEGLLRTALNSMNHGLLLTDPDGEVLLANPQMKSLYPEFADQFVQGARIGSGFTLLTGHPQYRAVLAGEVQEAMLEIELEDERVIAVGVRQTREGFISSTHSDISLEREAETERRRLLVDLMSAQRLQTVGRMSGMIAHDFNNIVASIKGYAGFLREDLTGDLRLRDFADRILLSTEKAEELILNILEYGDQRQIPADRVSLIPVLEDCLEMLEPTLSSSVRISFDPPEEPIWVDANETRLHRLFMNLLTNAARAMTGKDGRLEMVVSCFDALDLAHDTYAFSAINNDEAATVQVGHEVYVTPCVRVVMVDNGSGIDPMVMSRLFEPYFSTKAQGKAGGLGLASAADIALDFGGTIKLISKVNTGTIAEVVLPLAGSTPVYRMRADVRSPEGVCEVMIIEDDEDVGAMIRMTLGRQGICATLYDDPHEALESLLQEPDRWKVVISDQLMPGIKGTEIQQKMQEAGIDIPFLLCSAQIDPESTHILGRLETDFIAKPINRDELLAKVTYFLQQGMKTAASAAPAEKSPAAQPLEETNER